MAGRPFKVGRFAHSLRVRLMQEHVGVDVDALSEEDYSPRRPASPRHEQEAEQEKSTQDVSQFKHEAQARNVVNDLQDEVGQGWWRPIC